MLPGVVGAERWMVSATKRAALPSMGVDLLATILRICLGHGLEPHGKCVI